MDALPKYVMDYFLEMVSKRQTPAYVAFDDSGQLTEAGGDLGAFGLSSIQLEENWTEILDVFGISIPFEEGVCVIDRLEIQDGKFTQIHKIKLKNFNWILLLDDTKDSEQIQQIQQKRYDLSLLRNELSRRNRQLAKAHEAVVEGNRRIRMDLETAAKMQKALLPKKLPDLDGVRMAWCVDPCDELAGDTLNVIKIDEEYVAFYLIDVSGHGVPASLLSVTLSHVLSQQWEPNCLICEKKEDGGFSPTSPAEVMARLNAFFPMEANYNHYFTIFYGLLNTQTRELSYSLAGHPNPQYLPAGRDIRILEGRGFPIGWFSGIDYDEHICSLNVNDRVYIFSDGLLEAIGLKDDIFGSERLRKAICQYRNVSLEESVLRLRQEVKTWCDDHWQDDASIIALEIIP